ncbi:hypothetical protein [Gordonia humi]|uniref:Putative membrane protein n=1 Tax=Gordonia humi TaxID=686429 RepID=A0A840EW84_9ACTN|nr:hypothetical protein [Gordonia humi]MBB4137255.1 putative membrane protein [Gordonia humi]
MTNTTERIDRSRLVRRVATSAAATATLVATAALVTPATATAWDCPGVTEAQRALCASETTTTTPARSYTGGDSWSDRLPDLGFGAAIGIALIIGGIIALYMGKGGSSAGAHTPDQGVEAASGRGERAAGWASLGFGVIALGWGIWGVSGAILGAFIGVPLVLIAASQDNKADHEVAGYRIAQQQYNAELDRVRQIPVVKPGQFDDLGLNIPQQVQPFTPPPAPVISREEAYRLGRSNGFTVPAGSAAASLLDQYGHDGPARAGLDRVVEQLGWGAWTTQGEDRVWQPYVTLQGVSYDPDGDADVRLTVSHATVDESTIAKALPALLRTWNVRTARSAERADRSWST